MAITGTIQTAIERFLNSLNTEHTMQAYTTPLGHFSTYLSGQEIKVERDPVEVLTIDQAIEFVPWLRHDCFSEEGQPAKATLQLYLTATYRFYRSLLKQGVTFSAADIARLEETYRDARNIRGEARPKDPKLEAVLKIIAAARAAAPASGDKPNDRRRELTRLRDIAIVETLRSTGCRVGELVALRRRDLDWLACSMLVKGKGSKYRKVYVDERAWMALKTYLQARQDGGDQRALAYRPVFCGHGNRSGRIPSPLTTRHVARIIQSLAKKADLGDTRVTPHYFRHVFATRALERTENLALVQDMLGHASPATTRIYAKTDERQRQQGFAQVWEQAERTERAVNNVQAAVSILNIVRGRAGKKKPGFSKRVVLMQQAIIELLWAAGCRLQELAALRLEDVDMQEREVWFSLSGEPRVILLDPQTWSALEAYLRRRGTVATEMVFCEPGGSPLTKEHIFLMLKTAAEQAGLKVEADLFRQTFISLAQNRNMRHDMTG